MNASHKNSGLHADLSPCWKKDSCVEKRSQSILFRKNKIYCAGAVIDHSPQKPIKVPAHISQRSVRWPLFLRTQKETPRITAENLLASSEPDLRLLQLLICFASVAGHCTKDFISISAGIVSKLGAFRTLSLGHLRWIPTRLTPAMGWNTFALKAMGSERPPMRL